MLSFSIWIFIAHAISAFCLIGLIWTIQLLHYPAFVFIDRQKFQDFAAFHQTRISLIVIPFMLTELVTALLLPWYRPDFLPLWAAYTSAIFVALIWISTFTIQVPIHTKLSRKMDERLIQRLVSTNWIRTVAWSGRGLLLIWFLAHGLSINVTGQ